MQKLWTNDQSEIRQELELAIREEVLFSLFLAGQSPRPLKGREVTQEDGRHLVVFTKETSFAAGDEICYLIYQRPGQILRSFRGRAQQESQQILGLPLPEEILQVQYRNHHRTDTAVKAEVTVAGHPGLQLTVADISKEGARLIGGATPLARQGEAIGPITITLSLPFLPCPETTVLSFNKAQVVRTKELLSEHWEIGIHFLASAEEQAALERYLRLRAVEEASVNSQTQGANV